MYTEPTQDVFNYTYSSITPSITAKNYQLLRCHTLVWHSQLPSWVDNGNWTKEALADVIVNRVEHLVRHWKSKFTRGMW